MNSHSTDSEHVLAIKQSVVYDILWVYNSANEVRAAQFRLNVCPG